MTGFAARGALRVATRENGANVKITEETDYPFSDTIRFKLSLAKPAKFPLYLRVPGWCAKPDVLINSKTQNIDAEPR